MGHFVSLQMGQKWFLDVTLHNLSGMLKYGKQKTFMQLLSLLYM